MQANGKEAQIVDGTRTFRYPEGFLHPVCGLHGIPMDKKSRIPEVESRTKPGLLGAAIEVKTGGGGIFA
jgi:hypothetical protein